MQTNRLAIEALHDRVGGTPLVHAKRFAERVGLPNLHLKMEGANPTGTQKDRIALLEAAEARRLGLSGVCVASCGNFGVAIAHAAHRLGLQAHIHVPASFRGDRIALMQELGATVHEHPGTYEDCVDASRIFAECHGLHDANPGGPSTPRAMLGYAPIAEEVLARMGTVPAAIGAPVGNGTTLAGTHLGFRQAWARDETKSMPLFLAGTSANNHPLLPAVEEHADHVEPLDKSDVDETHVNEPLVNWDALDGDEALRAVQDAGGYAFGATDEELEALHAMLLEEGWDAHPASLAAVSALQSGAKEGLYTSDAPLVAILTSGRPLASVDRVQALPVEAEEFYAWMNELLGRFGDPIAEIAEAVQAALDRGAVLLARNGDEPVGFCILTPMELSTFFPGLHLSYLGVSTKVRGQGIGTLLLEEAIRIADGDLSLHVDIDNVGARRLYERFGFHGKYIRMLHGNHRVPTMDPAEGSGWSE